MAELSAHPSVCLCLAHRVDMHVLASLAWDLASVCLGVHDHVPVCLWVSMHAPIFFCVSPCAHTFFHVLVFLYLSVVSFWMFYRQVLCGCRAVSLSASIFGSINKCVFVWLCFCSMSISDFWVFVFLFCHQFLSMCISLSVSVGLSLGAYLSPGGVVLMCVWLAVSDYLCVSLSIHVCLYAALILCMCVSVCIVLVHGFCWPIYLFLCISL